MVVAAVMVVAHWSGHWQLSQRPSQALAAFSFPLILKYSLTVCVCVRTVSILIIYVTISTHARYDTKQNSGLVYGLFLVQQLVQTTLLHMSQLFSVLMVTAGLV